MDHQASTGITDPFAQEPPDEMNRRRKGIWDPKGGFAQLSAVWCFLAALELAAMIAISGTAVHADRLSLFERMGVLSYDLLILAGLVGVVGVTLALFSILARWGPFRRLGVSFLLSMARPLLVGTLVLLYVASWALFWSNELFIDRSTFAFWLPNPVQVFHWVPVYMMVGAVVSTIALTLVLSAWLPRWAASRRPETRRRLTLVATSVIGLSLILTLMGAFARGEGNRAQPSWVYAFNRDYRSGPFAHAFADLVRKRWGSSELSLALDENVRITRRPIVSMDEYLARVALERVKRWNVIIVHIESLRSDQLRVYGGSRDVMPAVDALARQSRVYTNAYLQASHSNYANPVSLSSHYPLRSPDTHLYPENPSYPRVLIYDVLKALGYRTAIFSSSNENWLGVINYLQTGNIDRFFYPETFDGPTYLMEGDSGFARWVMGTKHAGSIDDRVTVAEAGKWVDSLNGEAFFLYLHLQSSHVPYMVPKDFPRRFGPPKRNFPIIWGKFPKDEIDTVKNIYADSLAYVDHQLAGFLAHLESLGLWENTVVVIGGDNGEAFYEHGFAAHASALYNEVVKVPLIIRAPGLSPGFDHRPAQHLDTPPSIVDLLGLPPHPSFQGISLLTPEWSPERSSYLVVQTPAAHQYAIVHSGFKLIYDAWKQQFLLYNLENDPGEKMDLASTLPEVVQKLANRLVTWRNVQIDYYTDETVQAREYPPIVE